MSLFERVSTQLQSIEQNLELTKRALQRLRSSGPQKCSISAQNGSFHQGEPEDRGTCPDSLAERIGSSAQELRDCIEHFNLLYEIIHELSSDLSLDEVVQVALEVIWQKAPLSFIGIILGDDELGPYHYAGMKGIPAHWRYEKQQCPFPLSDGLARAMLQRLDSEEPDYLYISNIEQEGRPLPEEFPWMSQSGSLLIMPMRIQSGSNGVMLLGREEINGFDESMLCNDYYDIVTSIAKAIYQSQMNQEVNKNLNTSLMFSY